MKVDLEKAQKEVAEGAVERERFQAQLEMLVQELEKKQVNKNYKLDRRRLCDLVTPLNFILCTSMRGEFLFSQLDFQ